MKRNHLVFIIICSLFAITLVFAKEVKVLPNIPDALFNAVDTAGAGDILILADGGVYPNSQTLPVMVPLTIKTEDGAATKAMLVLAKNGSDDYSSNMIDANAPLTLINISAMGHQGLNSPYAEIFVNRGNISSGKILLDWVEVSRFRFISAGGDCDTLIVKNSIFNGNLSTAHGWGGTFDFQGDRVKYVRIQYNTFMFCTFGPFRDFRFGEYIPNDYPLETLIIDHNTFYNITGAHGPTTMFDNTKYVQFTNNLYINGTFRPLEFFSDKYIDFPENYDDLPPGGLISHLGPKGGWIIRASMCDSAGTQIVMRNNNISFTSDVLASWAAKGLQKPWVYTNEFKSAMIDTNDAWFEEELVFTDAPAVPMFAIDSIAVLCALGNADTAAYNNTTPYTGWEWWNPDMSPTFDLRTSVNMDMRYNRESKSFTAGDLGFPLGDLNWWPEWNPDAIETHETGFVSEFSLAQNYPNPFNPGTTISYTLQTTENVKLLVYNSLGQIVKTLVSGRMNSGAHSIYWDGNNAAGEPVASGIYYYKLQAGDYSKTKKMLLLR